MRKSILILQGLELCLLDKSCFSVMELLARKMIRFLLIIVLQYGIGIIRLIFKVVLREGFG